jgi:hypothetical protein
MKKIMMFVFGIGGVLAITYFCLDNATRDTIDMHVEEQSIKITSVKNDVVLTMMELFGALDVDLAKQKTTNDMELNKRRAALKLGKGTNKSGNSTNAIEAPAPKDNYNKFKAK